MHIDMLQFVLFMALGQRVAGSLGCRSQGPVVPPPLRLDSSPSFRSATAGLADALDKAINGSIEAGWPVQNGSFSVALVSLGQQEPAVPLWEYHHLASGNVNGTKKIDRNSQYLVGSVSKVISDAVFIRSGLRLDDPVTKYLPQLSSPTSPISWDNITLRHLGSQLSGIPPNYGFSEYYFLKSYFEHLGFPGVNDTEYPPCGVLGLNSGCSKEQLLKAMLEVRPVAQPMGKPVYSNIAFTIFAYALEAAARMNYTEQLRYFLTVPFGMASTFPSPGNDSLAVIPPVENSWGAAYGDNAPGGGLVSTVSDLSILLHSILNESILRTPTLVRQWLQPSAFTGSHNSLVGMPWEVFVPPAGSLTPRRPRSIPVYSKGGDAYGYSSRIAVVPELGIGLVVLTAGSRDALTYVFDAALSVLTAAADNAAFEEARVRGYVGSFTSSSPPPAGNESEANSDAVRNSITIAQDADSLRITALARNGSDILAAIQQLWAVTLGNFLPGTPGGNGTNGNGTVSYRIFPAGVSVPDVISDPMIKGGGETAVVREDWRLWWEVSLPRRSGLPGAGLSEQDCLTWAFADWLYYGGQAIDRIVFVKDRETGDVLGIDVPFLRSGLLRPVTTAG